MKKYEIKFSLYVHLPGLMICWFGKLRHKVAVVGSDRAQMSKFRLKQKQNKIMKVQF